MSALDEGDFIQVSTTTTIKVGGMETWVGVEARSKVRPGEDAEEARARVGDFVIQSVEDQINDTRAS